MYGNVKDVVNLNSPHREYLCCWYDAKIRCWYIASSELPGVSAGAGSSPVGAGAFSSVKYRYKFIIKA